MRTRQRQFRPDGQMTKWDFLWPAEMVVLAAQPFEQYNRDASGFEPGRCSICGEPIGTEALFAQHFVIPDRRYLNLGGCPNKS